MKFRIEENRLGGYTLTATHYRRKVAMLTSAVSENRVDIHSTFGQDPAGVSVDFPNVKTADTLNCMYLFLLANGLSGRIGHGFTTLLLEKMQTVA